MISEKLFEKIREEGKKKGYRIGDSGNEFDENGEFVQVIRLYPCWPHPTIVKGEPLPTKEGFSEEK